MAVTVKRKKVTLQSAKPDVSGSAPAAGVVGPGPASAVASPMVAAPSGSYTPFAIAAVIATLLYIGVVLVQFLEYSYLKNAFPLGGGAPLGELE